LQVGDDGIPPMMPSPDNIAGAGAATAVETASAPGGDEKDVDPPLAEKAPFLEVHAYFLSGFSDFC
jgi:hypothetical protein